MNSATCITTARSDLGEGPFWMNGKIYWVDIHGKSIHSHDPKNGEEKTIHLPKPVGAAVPRKGGGIIAALADEIVVVDEASGEISPLASPADQPPKTRFNDGKCDPAGRFWVGTMGSKDGKGIGTLYMLDRDHKLHPKIRDVAISNGIAWTRDQKTMYFTDTATNKIDAFDYDVADGSIKNRRTVIEIDPKDGHPDGMCIDASDNLWIGLWAGYAVVCIDPRTGERRAKIEIPAANCSSCAFGGENLDELFITTARAGTSEEVLSRHPLTGGVFRVKLDVKGLPTEAFAG